MAITATVSVNPSVTVSGNPVSVTLTVTNSGGADVNITNVSTYVNPSYSSSQPPQYVPIIKKVAATTGTNVSVWSQTFYYTATPNTPSPAGPGTPQMQFTVGCVVNTDDGSVTGSNQVLVNVTPATFPLVGSVAPGQYPLLPAAGQARFEANYQSGLFAALHGGPWGN